MNRHARRQLVQLFNSVVDELDEKISRGSMLSIIRGDNDVDGVPTLLLIAHGAQGVAAVLEAYERMRAKLGEMDATIKHSERIEEIDLADPGSQG